MGYLDVADRTWPLLRRAFGVHTVAYRLTGGLVGHRLPFVPQMLLLEHVGAKSGRRRTTPLVYFRDDDRIVLVASKGGYEKHPAWFHNLRANPETRVQVGHRRLDVRARVASDAERERLWPRAVETWPGYAQYQQRTERRIPLVVLEPR